MERQLTEFLDSGADYRVTAIQYSQRTTSTDDSFYRNKLYGEPDRSIEMPFFFWLIQGGQGTFLFDTGFSAASASKRSLTFLVEPVRALQALGVEPEDIDAVFLSHLHFDHTGHLHEFVNAHVYVDAMEYDFWVSGYGRKQAFAAVAGADDLAALQDMKKSGQATLLDGTCSVAPGIVSIRVGGHTPGQHILSVNTPDGPVVLASDALHFYEEMERDRPFVLFTDVQDMYRGYELLRAFEEAGAKVVAGHDMDVTRRFGSHGDQKFTTSI
jgi:glyoxylase-like metal-dependent hydrolase (beta-lactamase superfamily II)